MANYDLLLDIGHANNTGAQGNGHEEHQLSSVIGSVLAERCAQHGITTKVIDYPTLSNSADLSATVKEANTLSAKLGISLHCDSSSNDSARGAHVCYYSDKTQANAITLGAHICELMIGRACRVVQRQDLYVLKSTKHPWYLVEMGFISNKLDCNMLASHPELVAEAILKGVCDLLGITHQPLPIKGC